MKQMYLLVVVALVSLAISAKLFIVPTQAQNDKPNVRFEYAWLYLSNKGLPILKQTESETKIHPSNARGSGLTSNMRKGLGGYKLQSSSVRNDTAGALDIAGYDGWEAVSIVSNSGGIDVLLKRSL